MDTRASMLSALARSDRGHRARWFSRVLATAAASVLIATACGACSPVGKSGGWSAPEDSASAIGTTDPSDALVASRTPSMPASHTVWTIGSSVSGRPVVAETFGQGSRKILVMGGVHGNEYGGPVAEQLLVYVRAHPSVVPSGTELDIITRANPDGCAAHTRDNANNVDINRNFPASDWSKILNRHGGSPGTGPGSEPETQALLTLLSEQHYAYVVSLHSRGGLIDWDGAGGWTLARRLGKIAHVKVVQLPSYYGSMGSFLPERYHTPVITWELSSPVMDWRIRAALLAAFS